MSPRRTSASGEASILAMLEHEPARKHARGVKGPRLVWHGASAALVLGLTGALVWMAANNDGQGPEAPGTLLAEAEHGPGRNSHPTAASPAQTATPLQVAMVPAAIAAQASATALIVDQAPPAETVAPLRLLKPAPARPTAGKSTIPAVSATAAAATAHGRPGTAARPAPADAGPPPRAAATAAKSRMVVAPKPAARAVPARAQRGEHPARPAQAPVDADVALISAVIVHANGHAPEGSQMTELLCPNNACQERPARK